VDEQPIITFDGFVGHECSFLTPHQAYGRAVEYAYEQADRTLWVTNGECANQVNFCPFCGFKAETPVADDKMMPD
jgi:hypothetical protein